MHAKVYGRACGCLCSSSAKGQVDLKFGDELVESAQRYLSGVGGQKMNRLLDIWCIKWSAVCIDIWGTSEVVLVSTASGLRVGQPCSRALVHYQL